MSIVKDSRNRDQAGSPDAYALLVQAGFREQQPNATLQVHGLLKCLTDLRVDYFTLRQSVDQFGEKSRHPVPCIGQGAGGASGITVIPPSTLP